MSRYRILLVLLIGTGCFPSQKGCELAPLSEEPKPEFLASQSMEFVLSDVSDPALSAIVGQALADQEVQLVEVELSTLNSDLGGSLTFQTSPIKVQLPIENLDASLNGNHFLLAITFSQSQVQIPTKIYVDGGYLRSCSMELVIPKKVLALALALEVTAQGAPTVVIESEPQVDGELVAAKLDNSCLVEPSHSINPDFYLAVEGFILGKMQELSSPVMDSLKYTAGVELYLSGALTSSDPGETGKVNFVLSPDSMTGLSSDGPVRIGLKGGFESARSTCVPLNAEPLPASSVPTAVFKEHVPTTGQDYAMGISVSEEYVLQGLDALYRGGFFCRNPSRGDVEDVRIQELFPSMTFAPIDSPLRIAFRLSERPKLDFADAEENSGEILPRLVVTFTKMAMDFYSVMDGADVRVLGVSTDMSLVIVPEIEGAQVQFQLADLYVNNFNVEFSELLTEAAGVLRQAGEDAVKRVALILIQDLPILEIERPGLARGKLLGAERLGGRLLLYFAP